jgi:hypothetical protein
VPGPEIISLCKEFLGEPTFEWEDIMGNYRKQSMIVILLQGDKIRSLTAVSKLTIITIQRKDEIVCYDKFEINPSPKSILPPLFCWSNMSLTNVLCTYDEDYYYGTYLSSMYLLIDQARGFQRWLTKMSIPEALQSLTAKTFQYLLIGPLQGSL